MSDRSTSLEASRSVQRVIKLLVKSSPIISCTLTDSARRVQASIWSNSRTLPISCRAWMQRACTHARISCVVSKTHSLGRAILLGRASLLPPTSTQGDSTGADASIGDTFAPSDSPSRPCVVHLAPCCCLKVSIAKGRMRSEAMFQWLSDGGLRFIAIFGPCIRPWGNFSGSYSLT